jgi:hypothetical protein
MPPERLAPAARNLRRPTSERGVLRAVDRRGDDPWALVKSQDVV